MKPDFTETENYAIAYAKSLPSKASLRVIFPEALCLTLALAMAGFALYSSDHTWLIVSIIILAWNVLKNAYSAKTYSPVYSSIFKKYEDSIQQLSDKVNQHQD